MPHEIILDYETRSRLSLKHTNSVKYAAHPSTEVLCLAWAEAGWPEEIWRPSDGGFPLADYWPDVHILAFNAAFELAIWNGVCATNHGWPRLPPERIHCLQARAAHAGLPRKLDLVSQALGLGKGGKDMAGHRNMLRLCRPVGGKGAGTPRLAGCEFQGGRFDDDAQRHAKNENYCRRDVVAECLVHRLTPPLPVAERKLWLTHQRINERGVPVDLDLCRHAVQMVAWEMDRLRGELVELTGGRVVSPTQTAKLKAWLEADGCPLPNMQEGTIAAALKANSLPEPARRAITIRALSRDAAVAKYQAMLNHADHDGRCRAAHVYYQAGPGRWSGAGPQFQNLRRLSESEVPELVALADEISTARNPRPLHERLVNSVKGVIPVLGGMVRLAACAPAGKKLVVCDYSSIEMRCLHWISGDARTLATVRDFDNGRGADPYVIAAATICGKPIEEISPAERQLGKVQTLGCFAGDTLVITSGGVKPICLVNMNDKLWDGGEWVSHDGLLPKGKQATVNVAGVCVTPEHQVWTGESWHPANSLLSSCNTRNRALAAGWESLRSLVGFSRNMEAPRNCWSSVPAVVSRMKCRSGAWQPNAQHGAISAQRSVPQRPSKNGIGDTPISYQTQATELDYSTGSPQPSTAAKTPTRRSTATTAAGGFAYSLRGWRAEGRGGARRRRSVGENFWRILLLSTVGMIHYLIWIARTIARDMGRAICDLFRGARTRAIDEPSPNLKNVYDILNAGSRNRFTILTRSGPLVVHNCGFLTGAEKFALFCAGYGITMPLDRAQEIVQLYRRSYPLVKKLWYDLGKAAVRAVKDRLKIEVGPIEFSMTSHTLSVRLPSGRALKYHDARVVEGVYGEEIESLDQRSGGRRAVGLPILVENCAQGTGRDLLADALVKCDAEGLAVVLHCHDEIVIECEADDAESAGKLQEIMRDVPAWAKGLPVDAKPGEGRRYTK